MTDKYEPLEDLIQELEDEGHDLKRVIVDKRRVLVPREEPDNGED